MMSRNFDLENETNMDEELIRLHKELTDADPNYKNSPSFVETENLIKTKKMLKNGKILIEKIDSVLSEIENNPNTRFNTKELKRYKRDLTTFRFQLKKINPEIGEPLSSSSSEGSMVASVYYLKSNLQIKKLDKILG